MNKMTLDGIVRWQTRCCKSESEREPKQFIGYTIYIEIKDTLRSTNVSNGSIVFRIGVSSFFFFFFFSLFFFFFQLRSHCLCGCYHQRRQSKEETHKNRLSAIQFDTWLTWAFYKREPGILHACRSRNENKNAKWNSMMGLMRPMEKHVHFEEFE